MGSEFFINSQELEDKVRSLLPSQGGSGAGFDLSASTQIIPIIDLTESAEGSNLRQDLQKSLSLTSVTVFKVSNTTSTLVNNTGYYRVFGTFNGFSSAGADRSANFSLTDGTTTKIIQEYDLTTSSVLTKLVIPFDFIIFLPAGQSLTATSNVTQVNLSGVTRQLADIDGNLTNP